MKTCSAFRYQCTSIDYERLQTQETASDLLDANPGTSGEATDSPLCTKTANSSANLGGGDYLQFVGMVQGDTVKRPKLPSTITGKKFSLARLLQKQSSRSLLSFLPMGCRRIRSATCRAYLQCGKYLLR